MKNSKRNWKTTLLGVVMLGLSGLSVYSNPAKATDPQTIGTIAGGIGLVLAKDADKTGKE